MQSSRKWDTDAVWILEVDTDLDAETARLRKHIDFKRLRARFARGNRQRVKSLVTWGTALLRRAHILWSSRCAKVMFSGRRLQCRLFFSFS